MYFVSPNQMTPLHVAAENGRFKLVKLLVNKKADINIKDNDGVSKVVHLIEGTIAIVLVSCKGFSAF